MASVSDLIGSIISTYSSNGQPLTTSQQTTLKKITTFSGLKTWLNDYADNDGSVKSWEINLKSRISTELEKIAAASSGSGARVAPPIASPTTATSTSGTTPTTSTSINRNAPPATTASSSPNTSEYPSFFDNLVDPFVADKTTLSLNPVGYINSRLNTAAGLAFPGFCGLIENYTHYNTYIKYFTDHPNMTDQGLANWMAGDEDLKNFAKKYGYDPAASLRSTKDPSGLADFTNFVVQEYAKINGGQASISTVVHDDGVGANVTLGTFAKQLFNNGFQISDTKTRQDVANVINSDLSPVSGGEAPVNTDAIDPVLSSEIKRRTFITSVFNDLAGRNPQSHEMTWWEARASQIGISSGKLKTEIATSIASELTGTDKFINDVINGNASLVPSYSDNTQEAPGESGGASSARGSAPANHQYRLIRGDGSPAADSQLRNNGNAVFLVSSSGELFHVTADLASRMQAQGLWYEPEVVAQSQVNGMNLRGSLQYVEELGVLNIPPAGNGYLLVRGDSTAHLGTAQLSGNGDAVYAIDTEGNKFHVTAAVAQQMVANNTWTEPAILNQGTVDRSPVAGALASPSGGTAPLEVPVTPSTPAPVTGGTTSPTASTGVPSTTAPTATTPSDPTMGKPFELVQGNNPGTGETQLKGNGAAVYAVFADGTKLHVTAPMAAQLVANNKWTTPRMVDQATLDAVPPSGSLATINGGRAALVIPFDPTAATTTTTTTRTQSAQTESVAGVGMATEVSVNATSTSGTWTPEEVWDSQGQMQDINDPKYGYTEQQKQDIKNFIWNNGGTWAGLEEMAVSYEGGVQAEPSQFITLPDTSPEAPTNSSKPADPVVAAPVASAPAEPAKIIVTDATGVARDLTNETPANQLAIQQHINGGGTFAQIDQIAAIYASGDATAIDNWERMTLTGKYSATTAYGAEYQKALQEGYTAEIAKIWCDGKFANDMQGATTSSSTPVPIMSAGQPYNPTGL